MIAALLATVASGCAANTPAGPPQVSLSLVAPTDGATVFVRRVVVFGHVNPSGARVVVAGRRATVRKGTFKVRMRLVRSVNRIGILATASGYRAASLATTVRFSHLRSLAPARPAAHSGSHQPTLPSDFASRAEKVCSTAIAQSEAVPSAQLPLASALARQVAIARTMTRQLIALMSPAAQLPAVQTFTRDLHRMVAMDVGIANDLLQGRGQAADRIVRQTTVLAPQWWQDGGRLGVPDCGAQWQPT